MRAEPTAYIALSFTAFLIAVITAARCSVFRLEPAGIQSPGLGPRESVTEVGAADGIVVME